MAHLRTDLRESESEVRWPRYSTSNYGKHERYNGSDCSARAEQNINLYRENVDRLHFIIRQGLLKLCSLSSAVYM